MNLETTELAFGGAKRVSCLAGGHKGFHIRYIWFDFVPTSRLNTGMSPTTSPITRGEPTT